MKFWGDSCGFWVDKRVGIWYYNFRIWLEFGRGEMSEWFKEPVLKTGDSKEPWVRIPLSPPSFLRLDAKVNMLN
ncbi:hypothetical protein KL86CLO1_11624 [uncultured Eubacteriales bacterium]|uniref:Uncharacterized protein n=1 Tax=uncultured Eubacteriales bacterium TaxID=172733 RepID=A0A212JS41_9FIRM|nr:hypothetical protein KL86CLO1_11624 [uncultured Eubacteriales bacterium]